MPLNITPLDLCAGRPNEPHCDHETGSVYQHRRVTQRTHTCCFCGRQRVEEVAPPSPAPNLNRYVAKRHGPHVATFITYGDTNP